MTYKSAKSAKSLISQGLWLTKATWFAGENGSLPVKMQVCRWKAEFAGETWTLPVKAWFGNWKSSWRLAVDNVDLKKKKKHLIGQLEVKSFSFEWKSTTESGEVEKW